MHWNSKYCGIFLVQYIKANTKRITCFVILIFYVLFNFIYFFYKFFGKNRIALQPYIFSKIFFFHFPHGPMRKKIQFNLFQGGHKLFENTLRICSSHNLLWSLENVKELAKSRLYLSDLPPPLSGIIDSDPPWVRCVDRGPVFPIVARNTQLGIDALAVRGVAPIGQEQSQYRSPSRCMGKSGKNAIL
jgi:hypothetical protein